jgi:hypothetical protein
VQAVADPIIDIAFKAHADELRASWPARVLIHDIDLVAGFTRPRSLLGGIILSVLAHNFDDAMPVLLRVCFPGFASVGTPFLCSAAKIARTGQVMADVITKDGQRLKNQAAFKDERTMEKAFRELADETKLTDDERKQFFAAVQKWVVADYRLDPTMSRDDPDAKRFKVVN